MNRYLDWRFRGTTWVALVLALACVICSFVLPVSFGDKNSPLENVQMAIVIIGLFLTCTAKEKKSLYVFASLTLFLILAREVNFGRTLFIFADPEKGNVYPKWKDFEYGWVARVIVGLYMLWMLVYFIWRKVWRELWDLLRGYRLPVMDAVLAAGGMVIALVFEYMHNCLSEELGEIVLYAGGVGIIYLYTRNKVHPVE